MNANRTLPALALTAALSLTLTLTACSTDTPAPNDPTAAATPVAVATTQAGAAASAPAEPRAEVTEAPAPEADAYSQVIDGVLYQGTASAPVRIGTDTPGKAPAAEAGFQRNDGWKDYAQSADKYVVTVGQGLDGGWLWKIFGLSKYGSFREVSNNGYQAGKYFPTRDAALADTFTVDGRTLDRSEYILVVN